MKDALKTLHNHFPSTDRSQQLQRDGPRQITVAREVDLAHSAGAQQTVDVVTGEDLSRFESVLHALRSPGHP
ncbi:hypothetical protein [Nocardia sp. NBC_01329]|uniref:hypothetical protein n=1 Tax=Nocardia sp. NBC_01329 TaxID=2903594 RepID=UPI003FA37B68